MISAFLTALTATMPVVVSPAPQSAVMPWLDRRPKARGERLLRDNMMSAHNQARRQYGVAPLAWDAMLARDAAVYAAQLARSGRFQHDPQTGRRVRQGENLWMGTRGAYHYAEMIGLLIAEGRYFRPGIFPNVSTTGNWSHVAHYTQIIWPESQRVGCATAANRINEYLVCRYSPAGNIAGFPLR